MLHLLKNALIFLLLAGCAASAFPQEQAMKPVAKSFEKTFTRQLSTRYLLYLPEGYDAGKDKTWPLVLFLHGSGERGADLTALSRQGLPKMATGKSFPFILVAPQVPEGQLA